VDVAAWLHSLGMQQYERAFRDNAIDTAVLPELTADDLKDLGVTLVGHRRRLLGAIAALRGNDPAPPATSGEAALASAAERRQLTVMFCDLVGSELNKHKGQLLHRQGYPEAAEKRYRKALSIAEEQGAKLWELRAAASLARLRCEQGRHAEARDLLAPVYSWFTEGFGTPDLKEAKALLDELG
jgi:tetratricopeptide (TPR) repeat protein